MVDKAFFDREQLISTLGVTDVEIEFRLRLPHVPASLIRHIKPTSYTEVRYLHPDHPHVKLRVRDGSDGMISKTAVSKYSLEPHWWCTLCVSIEEPYVCYEPHRLFKLDTRHVECFRVPVRDACVMEIKNQHVEVEFHRYTDDARDLAKRTLRTILNEAIAPYMPRDVFDACTYPFRLSDYPKPVPLQHKHIQTILSGSWYVTYKNDGERVFLLLKPNDGIYEASAQKPYFCRVSTRSVDKTMLVDCERVGSRYYVLDYDDFTDTPFEERHKKFGQILPFLTAKPYQKIHDIHDVAEYAQRAHPKNDGLLIIDGTRSYQQSVIYKWKQMNTVDLLVQDGRLYCHDHVEFTLLPYSTDGLHDNVIYEFFVVSELIPMRERPDKLYPNTLHVVRSNIYHGITLDFLQTVGCKAMRKYHNVVKQECLDSLSNDVLIDIGTGHGTDVHKWKDTTNVYCIEPDPDKCHALEKRLRGSSSNVHLICAKLSLDLDFGTAAAMDVTTFFCLNLFAEDDLATLAAFFEQSNIGKWIAIYMDYDLLVSTFGEGRMSHDFTLKIHPTYTFIDIPQSKVRHLVEHPLTLDQLIARFPMMELESHHALESPLLSGDQYQLSQCFVVATFHRR